MARLSVLTTGSCPTMPPKRRVTLSSTRSATANTLSEKQEVFDGIRRLTFRLPLGIDHVHCYFLRASDGGWILVDTGLGVDDPEFGQVVLVFKT